MPFSRTETDIAAAIITAAGKSTRMGGGLKKEYRTIGDLPALRRVYQTFIETGLFQHLVITCPPGDEDRVREVLGLNDSQERVLIVPGGETRQASVYAGLAALESFHPRWVLVHDGSRPWVSSRLIGDILDGTRCYGACIPVVPPVDTLVTLTSDGNTHSYLNRNLVFRVQTPQGFSYPELLRAHGRAAAEGPVYNDDSEIYGSCVGTVHTIPGDPANRKITYPGDL